MTTQTVDIVETFDLKHAFREWHKRGFSGEELVQILTRDLAVCKERGHRGSQGNVERMLEVLEDES